jgi:hypothetical protein
MEDSFFRDTAFVTKTIRLLRSEAEDTFSYDAVAVGASMRSKYEIE